MLAVIAWFALAVSLFGLGKLFNQDALMKTGAVLLLAMSSIVCL